VSTKDLWPIGLVYPVHNVDGVPVTRTGNDGERRGNAPYRENIYVVDDLNSVAFQHRAAPKEAPMSQMLIDLTVEAVRIALEADGSVAGIGAWSGRRDLACRRTATSRHQRQANYQARAYTLGSEGHAS
jgi:hypothetical protein